MLQDRRTTCSWLSACHDGVEQALQIRPVPGVPPNPDGMQMAQPTRIVRTKNPLQLRFVYAPWILARIR